MLEAGVVEVVGDADDGGASALLVLDAEGDVGVVASAKARMSLMISLFWSSVAKGYWVCLKSSVVFSSSQRGASIVSVREAMCLLMIPGRAWAEVVRSWGVRRSRWADAWLFVARNCARGYRIARWALPGWVWRFGRGG